MNVPWRDSTASSSASKTRGIYYPYPTWNEICGHAAVPAKQNTDASGDPGRFTSKIRLLDSDVHSVQTGLEGRKIAPVCSIS